VPPMYSAKKIQGQKLYELARRGVEVERAARRVTIYELEALHHDGAVLRHNDEGTIDLSIRVVCSAGTYIRTLAESTGERLGTRAHLAALKRTRAGDFRIESAISLDDLKSQWEAKGAGEAIDSLLPFDAALSGLPFVHLTADGARKALNGMELPVEQGIDAGWRANEPVRMRDSEGHLIAIGFYDAASRTLRPRVVFSPEK
jgi:tRNA pseudouridine55 synthase